MLRSMILHTNGRIIDLSIFAEINTILYRIQITACTRTYRKKNIHRKHEHKD